LAEVPPAITGLGHDERTTNSYVLRIGDEQCIVFDYSYVTGSGKSEQTHNLSIGWFRNAKTYPHLFLDGKQNGASYAYARSQQLSLEGDFDKYFNLYIPDGQQVDALSILAPDVMQTLVDGGRPYDIEVTGNDVFVIARNTSYTPEKLPALLQFMETLKREFDHSDLSWKPLVLPTESWQSDTLQRSKRKLYVNFAVLLVIAVFYIVILLVTHNAIHIATPYGP
jgi:hypothetical protein